MSNKFVPSFDLLLKNGRVIDPANEIDDDLDVGISGTIIGAVEKSIDPSRSKKTIDASGLIVSPGLIDLHAHFWGYEWSVMPDELCLSTGVTTAVDAGGAGHLTFDDFNNKIISKSKVRIFAFLNISGLGMTGEPEQDLEGMSIESSLAKVRQRPDLIIGLKVAHYLGPDWEPLDRAVEVARNSKTFVMVDQNPISSRPMDKMMLEHMESGDVVTHCYGSGKNMIDFSDKVHQYFFEARNRGIKFDVGHGAGSFSWRVAQSAIDQGFLPDTISTDLHSSSYLKNQATMPETMSKLLVCGISIQDVFKMSTIEPAKQIGHPELGSLTVSGVADVAVFKLSQGDFGFTDNGLSGSRVRKGAFRLDPEITIKSGEVFWDRNGRTKSDWLQTAPIDTPNV
ncbi:MAG: amidohydrolase/deacetylase family metallohydrolase [SAR202 cluster bacterium]|nr:amidohydrolase/deacetylase family metallohydrolase [SAR202 cluster bacterium]